MSCRRFTGARVIWFFAVACASEETSCPVDPTRCHGYLEEGSHLCVALAVQPGTGEYQSRLLEGDTVRMSTKSDSGYASPVAWSVSGVATAVAESESSPPGYSTVLVRGTGLGTATVVATHTNPDRTASSTLTFSDSTVIERIDMGLYSPTAKVFAETYLAVQLKDGARLQYNARPDGLSSSDPTIATVGYNASGAAYVYGRKQGTVDITATFLTLSKTLQVTVAP